MKRTIMVALILVSFILISTVFTFAKELAIENNGFESTAEPREGEIFFGWNPYYGGDTNATIVTEKVAEGTHSLKLVGIEGEYVGVRSARFPIEAGKEYSISLQTFIEGMEEPATFEVYLEFWPVGYSGNSTKMRLVYHRMRGRSIGSWRTMSGTIMAPESSDSASIFIFIGRSEGTVYVDDIHIEDDTPEIPSGIVYSYPNVISKEEAVRLSYLPHRPGQCTIQIYDESGRVLFEEYIGYIEAEINEFIWDGRDRNGNFISPGIYTSVISVKEEDGSYYFSRGQIIMAYR